MIGIQEKFDRLKSLMQVTRDTVLSDKELQSVFLTFPALLVAHSDGMFDVEEKCEVFSICEQLVSDEISDNLRPSRVAELYHVACSLANQGESYTEDIHALIRDEITDQPESKALIEGMIRGMAESSDGVSDVEQTMIERLVKDLKLKEE